MLFNKLKEILSVIKLPANAEISYMHVRNDDFIELAVIWKVNEKDINQEDKKQ
jgi:hypothetical protein